MADMCWNLGIAALSTQKTPNTRINLQATSSESSNPTFFKISAHLFYMAFKLYSLLEDEENEFTFAVNKF